MLSVPESENLELATLTLNELANKNNLINFMETLFLN